MVKLSFIPSGFPETASVVRSSVYVLGKVALVSAVAFAYLTGSLWLRASQVEIPSATSDVEPLDDKGVPKPDRSAYDIIESRNLFGAKKVDVVRPQAVPQTQLKLRLLGTNITTGSTPIAIIEDSAKRQEDVFELNELVFKQAKLVEIRADHVKLDLNGKLEILRLDDAQKGPTSPLSGAESEPANEDQTDFVVAESEVTEALSNLPQLLSQARAVPYFRNGASIGMRLFAIRRGSLYEKIGLKNGDIIKVINDTNISDPTQAIKLFEELKSQRSIGVKIERDGTDKQLNYSVQ